MITAIKFEPKINFEEIFSWLISKEIWFAIILLVGVLGSALAVSYQKHWSRNLHSSYQVLVSQSNKLEVEWRQLLVEKRTWSNANRIAIISENHLDMRLASLDEIIMV